MSAISKLQILLYKDAGAIRDKLESYLQNKEFTCEPIDSFGQINEFIEDYAFNLVIIDHDYLTAKSIQTKDVGHLANDLYKNHLGTILWLASPEQLLLQFQQFQDYNHSFVSKPFTLGEVFIRISEIVKANEAAYFSVPLPNTLDKEDLKDISRLKRQFLGFVSSDIENNFKDIQDLINNYEGEMSESLTQLILHVFAKVERSWDYFQKLSEISKFELTELLPHIVDFSIGELIEENVQRIQLMEGREEFEIDLHIDSPLPKVKIDPQKIKTLLSNAVVLIRGIADLGEGISLSVKNSNNTNVEVFFEGVPTENFIKIFSDLEHASIEEQHEMKALDLLLLFSKIVIEIHSGTMEFNPNQDKKFKLSYHFPIPQ